jgi:hypothetical protein
METKMKVATVAIAAGVAMCAYAWYSSADAADLGGNCCADLEERIAELEATTARKGTRTTSLNIYGQVNKSIVYYDVDDVDFSDTSVLENGASETFVGFAARVQIDKDWSAGGVIELGQGKSGVRLDLLSGVSVDTNNDLYTRQSYVFVAGPMGKVSVGLQSMATDDLSAIAVANTDASSKRLTLQPLGNLIVSLGPIELLTLDLEPFNGHKANAVRYDSPVFAGFSASAAWESEGDSWDASLRYAGEGAGFLFKAAAGYEVDKADDLIGLLGASEVTTLSVHGGVKHIASGIFAQGSWARLEIDPFNVETDAWHVQAGWEGKLVSWGTTTIWGEVSDWSDLDLQTYAIGVNQNLAGGVDAYVLGRQIDVGDVEAKSLMGGMRVRF